MITEPYKILILEDVEGQYLAIRKRLTDTLGDRVIVYPDRLDRTASPENFYHLVDLLKQGKDENFKEIVEKFEDISIFVVDNVFLKNDHTGTNFRNYLRKENYRNNEYNLLLVTATEKNSLPAVDWQAEREQYIDKKDNNYVAKILQTIIGILGIDEATLSGNKGQRHLYSLGEWLHFVWEGLKHKIEFLIDKLILTAFYVLIAVVTFNALRNIGSEFLFKAADPRADSLKQVARTYQQKRELIHVEDTDDLKKAEHIYLYLIPIFIVFGFFNYYKGYIRASLLTDKVGEIEESTSTKAMRLTKILFISSIISYVCIRVIEELFSPAPDFEKLIGAGVLILILIGYFVFLENDSHKG